MVSVMRTYLSRDLKCEGNHVALYGQRDKQVQRHCRWDLAGVEQVMGVWQRGLRWVERVTHRPWGKW